MKPTHKWENGVLKIATEDPYSLFRSFVINFTRYAYVLSNARGEFSNFNHSSIQERKRFGSMWSKFHQSQYKTIPDTEKRKLLQDAQDKGATVRGSLTGYRLDNELLEAKLALEADGRP